MVPTEPDDCSFPGVPQNPTGEELPVLVDVLKASNKLFEEHASSLKSDIVSIVDSMISRAAAEQAGLYSRYENKSIYELRTNLRDTALVDTKTIEPNHSVDKIPPSTAPPELPLKQKSPEGSEPEKDDVLPDAPSAAWDEQARKSNFNRRESKDRFASFRQTLQKMSIRINRTDTTDVAENPRGIRKTIMSTAAVMGEPKSRAVFGSPQEALVEKVRTALLKQSYDVQDYYFETGWAQAVAKSPSFEYVTMCVIAFNAFWIAVEYDAASLHESEVGYQIVEHTISVFFLVELVIRYFAFQSTKYAFSDRWFAFDACLVFMMIMDTYILNTILFFLLSDSFSVNTTFLRIIRLMRLTKMARMIRLLRWLQELVVLLKGLGLASKSVMFTLLLLTVIIYIFAITFRQLTVESDCDTCIGTVYFKDVPTAFSTLLLRGTLPDMADFVTDVADESILLAALLMVFIFLAAITVMNMLTGILVEVVSNVSSIESETVMVQTVRQRLFEMLDFELGETGRVRTSEITKRKISREEFELLVDKPHFAQFIQGVGVDVVGLVESSDFIFRSRELFFYEFVELILQLRGTNVATVRDLVDLRRFISGELGSDSKPRRKTQRQAPIEHEEDTQEEQPLSKGLSLSLTSTMTRTASTAMQRKGTRVW